MAAPPRHLTMTRDDEWCTKVLNTFIATVESLEEVQRAPMAPGGPSLVDPAYQRQVETLRRAVRSEFTSASVALDQVIHDWSGRKAGFFTSKEAHQKELAQEAVALIERREEHAAHGGLDQPPGLDEEQLHRWVWEAARGLWRSGHHRQAVAAAVEAVVSEVQNRTGYGLSGAPLFEAAFNAAEPKSDGPRLMLMPFEKSETYRNVQNGVKSLGQACVSALRNPAAHGNRNQLHPQMALEQLAMISVLARWVEQSQVKRHDDDIAVSSEVTEVDFVKTFEAALHDGTPQ